MVLKAISLHPMHGYEAAKQISAMFEGTYVPGSGVIYPTLQWLEDGGYIVGSRLDDKTVYTITKSGKKYLKLHEATLNEIVHYMQGRKEDQGFSILRSAARLQRTIVANLPEMTKEDKAQVTKILNDANDKVSRLMRK